jgi:hypothetical protein
VNSPNRENIDRWLFDWTEGNLTPTQEFILQEFLLLNPDLEIDADSWDTASVSSIPFTYNNQESLKRRKKRFFAYWQFYAAALLLIIFGSSLFFNFMPSEKSTNAKNLVQQAKLKSKETKSLKNTSTTTNSTVSDPLKVEQNFLRAESYDANLKIKNLLPENNKELSIKNELTTSPILEEVAIIEDIILPANTLLDYQLNPSISFTGHSDNLDLSGVADLEEEIIEEKKNRTFSPSLKLNSSSAISKWVKKDVTNTNQKDRIYSLPEKSNLDLNSSFVGSVSQLKFQSMSTARWIKSSDQQKIAQQISLDGYIRKAKSGLGIVSNYTTFSNGLIQDWNINLIYAPKIALNRYITIEPSMKYTFGKKVLDKTKIIHNSVVEFETNQLETFSIDPTLSIGKNLWYRDLGAGLVINAGPIYIGAQLNNILKHQDNLYSNDYSTIRRANQEVTLIGGTDFISKNGNFRFSPYVCHTISGSLKASYLGASVQVKSLFLGGSYQTNGSSSYMIGLNSDRFALFCQSSYVNSSYSQKKSFIHQLTFRINSNISKKTRRYLYL